MVRGHLGSKFRLAAPFLRPELRRRAYLWLPGLTGRGAPGQVVSPPPRTLLGVGSVRLILAPPWGVLNRPVVV